MTLMNEKEYGMKKRFLTVLLCLVLMLSACGQAENTEPVLQMNLEQTGVSVTVSNCSAEQTTADYWIDPENPETHSQLMMLRAEENAPVLHFDAPKTQIDITFARPVEGGYALYTLALPVEKVDMIPTENSDGTTSYRFDTIYDFVITVTDGERSDRFLLVCSRQGYNQ